MPRKVVLPSKRMLGYIRNDTAYWCGWCLRVHYRWSKLGRKHRHLREEPPTAEAGPWEEEDDEFEGPDV